MQRKKNKKLTVYSKSYSMVTQVGMLGAPPGGGEGTWFPHNYFSIIIM